MTNHEGETGLELVVDNRKLIITFLLLIAICGTFWVWGFREGKRQGREEGAQTAAEYSAKKESVSTETKSAEPARVDQGVVAAKQEPADQQLDWYKNVSRKDGEPESIPTKDSSETKATAAAAASSVVPADTSKEEDKEPLTYSAQVGAFVQKQELENRAKVLREKGFECWIDPPQDPKGFYLLKVGKFHSRAEAVAMRLKLKESGFPSIIKTN